MRSLFSGECYNHSSFMFLLDDLQPLVQQSCNLVIQNCEQFVQFGEYKFQNEYFHLLADSFS
jgi:hypothetical protein